MTEQEERNLAFLLCLRKIQNNHFPYVHRSPLSTAEFYALFAILRLQEAQDSAGPEIRVSSLIETLNLSPQAVSKTLRLLEQKGYCKRITDPNNRRNTLVLITEQGTTLVNRTKSEIARFVEEVTKRMGDENMAEFIRLSNQCSAIMQEVEQAFYQEFSEKKEELT